MSISRLRRATRAQARTIDENGSLGCGKGGGCERQRVVALIGLLVLGAWHGVNPAKMGAKMGMKKNAELTYYAVQNKLVG